MKVDKMSISLPADLGDEVREAAGKSGEGLSGWLADAARRKLQHDAFWKFVTEWEAEHGPLTEGEMAQAQANWGEPVGPPAA